MSTEIMTPGKQELLAQPNPPMKQLIAHAVLSGTVSIEVIERLAKLQREEVEYEAMVEFNEAMHRCQEKMGVIVAESKSDKGKFASYAQVYRIVKPIYTAEGISLSFSDGEPIAVGWLRIICHVSRGGYTRLYHKDMPLVTVGAKGNAVMTPIHAQGSSDSYAKRYLVADIFNLAIDKNDDDGNGGAALMPGFDEFMENIVQSSSLDELKARYGEAFRAGEEFPDWISNGKFTVAFKKRKKELSA